MRNAVLCAFWFMAFAAYADPAAKSTDAAGACASGSGAACRELGDLAHDRKDYTAAGDRYEQACKLDDGEACGRLAFSFFEGTGRPKDLVKAAALFEQACGKVAAYCGMLGHQYANGVGVERDPARAVALLHRACGVRMPSFCSQLGTMLADGYGTTIDEPAALAALDQGCRGDDGLGCFVLGDAYERGELGLARRVERGQALLARACELGQQGACNMAQRLCSAAPKTCGKPLVSLATAQLSRLHEQLVNDLVGKTAGCDEIAAQGSAFTQAHAREIDGVKRELDGYGTPGYHVGLDGDLLGKLGPLLKSCPDRTLTTLFDAGFRPWPMPHPTAAAAPPRSPASGQPAKAVSPKVLELLRVAGEKVIVPDPATKLRIARHIEGKLVGSFKLCINAAGNVVGVQRLRSTGFPAYDATIEAAIGRWKYRPMVEAGQAVPVCSAVTYVYSQS